MSNIPTTASKFGDGGVLRVEIEQEEDGRWLAEFPALPGVMAYGGTRKAAQANAEALAQRVLADQPQHCLISSD